ncbi:MAG: hypothetical protein QXR58_01135, partial [Candidatus Micrarchaeaceae archaeon]
SGVKSGIGGAINANMVKNQYIKSRLGGADADVASEKAAAALKVNMAVGDKKGQKNLKKKAAVGSIFLTSGAVGLLIYKSVMKGITKNGKEKSDIKKLSDEGRDYAKELKRNKPEEYNNLKKQAKEEWNSLRNEIKEEKRRELLKRKQEEKEMRQEKRQEGPLEYFDYMMQQGNLYGIYSFFYIATMGSYNTYKKIRETGLSNTYMGFVSYLGTLGLKTQQTWYSQHPERSPPPSPNAPESKSASGENESAGIDSQKLTKRDWVSLWAASFSAKKRQKWYDDWQKTHGG